MSKTYPMEDMKFAVEIGHSLRNSKYDLSVEFWWSFDQERQAGFDVLTATYRALGEWDVDLHDTEIFGRFFEHYVQDRLHTQAIK